ncbi:MAG TPA: peptide chain release factor N(5)-glutamine methyltransferase [Candidatus Saccharimonadales bacterium]|nr:peptide chain release factor N(5)-glutamine methyltransferase [Candidatus Saccharimonadales bacterium]
MTVEQAVKTAAATLEDNGYVHGEREAVIFLSHILNLDTTNLYNRYEDNIDPAAEEQLAEAVETRLKGAPVAYIVGDQNFMGWAFLSDKRALIPRPETEQLVELLIRRVRDHKVERGKFLEIGTGAGPIAIALKKYFPQAEITATDVSEEALELAQENAQRLKVDITIVESDLFDQVPPAKYDVIVANLPYVPSPKLDFVSDQILDWEPMVAIDAGDDGLKYITPFLEQIKPFLSDYGIVALEFWHTHGQPVKELVAQHLPDHEVEIEKDLAGFDRFAFITPE